MFAEHDKHYPSRFGQTSLARALTHIAKPVTKNNFGPSTWLTGWNAGKAGKTRGEDHILPPEQKRKPRTTTRMVENAPSQSLRFSVSPFPPWNDCGRNLQTAMRGRWTAHHLDIHQRKVRACGTISFAVIVFQTASDKKGLFRCVPKPFCGQQDVVRIFLFADSLQCKSDTFQVFLHRK